MISEIFLENKKPLVGLRRSKDLIDEINLLKKKIIKSSDKEALEIKGQIEWLEDKLKKLFL